MVGRPIDQRPEDRRLTVVTPASAVPILTGIPVRVLPANSTMAQSI
jgi:hypothetical protein